MKKIKLKKYATITTASFLVLQLGACSSLEENDERLIANEISEENTESEVSYNVPDD